MVFELTPIVLARPPFPLLNRSTTHGEEVPYLRLFPLSRTRCVLPRLNMKSLGNPLSTASASKLTILIKQCNDSFNL